MHNTKKLLSLVILVGIAVFISCTTQPDNTAISSDGVEIKFDVQGKGEPALVFVTGWGGNRTNWEKQMYYFENTHKVVAIDYAGFGESGNNRKEWTMEAFGEDIVAVIKKLKLEKVILVGQSMGGAIILEAARKISDRVVGIVPVDMFQNVEQKYSNENIELIINSFQDLIENPTPDKWRSAIFTPNTDQVLIDKVIAELPPTPKKGWLESARQVFKWMSNDLTNVLQEIRTPICCINSDMIPTNIEVAQKYAPAFKVKIIQGAGHAVMVDVPDKFNRLLEETIQEFLR